MKGTVFEDALQAIRYFIKYEIIITQRLELEMIFFHIKSFKVFKAVWLS